MVAVWYNRELHDGFAFVAHGLSLTAAVTATPAWAATTAGALIVAQEAVTIVFHVLYGVQYVYAGLGTRPNLTKWTEYALSATIGTVATLSTGAATSPWYWVLFLVIAGAGQQTVGYRIDLDQAGWVAFWFAAALQVGEFCVVWGSEPAWRVAAVYTAGWSAFGVHAGTILWYGPKRSVQRIRHDEAIYSCLSWVAKLAVFWNLYADGTDAADTVFAVSTAVSVIVVALVLARSEPAPAELL